MTVWAQRVFWSEVRIMPVKAAYRIFLDDRALKTPGEAFVDLPTSVLAEAVAREWRGLEKDSKIDPKHVPLTRFANTAIDKVVPQFEAVADMLSGYGETDLICYFAAQPDALIERQTKAWRPLLDWFAKTHGVDLQTTHGVMPVQQSPEVRTVCKACLQRYSSFELAALHDLITLSGSFVIGLAVAEGVLSVEGAWQAARIDEDWQIEEWGKDDEAAAAALDRETMFHTAKSVFDMLNR